MTPKPDHQNPLPSASLLEIPAVESSLIKQFVDDDVDHPPDSFWLSKDAELDWFDRNAFFERNYSTKGTSNSNSTSVSSNLPAAHKQLTKSKASIIWIPKTTQRRSTFPETKQRRAPPTITLLPKRSDGFNSGKAGAGATNEPSSPKVSCTGRVRQKKEKSKSEKKQSKKTRSSRSSPETPRSDSSHRRKSSSTRLWTKLRDVFRSGKLIATAKNDEVESPSMRWRTKRSKSSRAQHSSLVEPIPVHLNRFASGRKSDSWITELKTTIDEVDALRSDQKDVGLWSRRNFDAPKELDCSSRDWMDNGPASV